MPISCNYWTRNSPALPLPSDCYAPLCALHPIMSATLCTSHVDHTLPVYPGRFALANGCRPSRHRPRCISADPFPPLPPTISLQPFIPYHLFTYSHTHLHISFTHHIIISFSSFFIFLPFTPSPTRITSSTTMISTLDHDTRPLTDVGVVEVGVVDV